MDAVKLAVTTFWTERNKERFEMILEPLQAITQLALLSYCPVGSKLSIVNNVLFIQTPSWDQSVKRSYNSDKKNDLIYLFAVIKRFHKFYDFMNDITNSDDNVTSELFSKLIKRSKIGIEKLIQTYSKSEGVHLSQTLRMYIQLIDKPESFPTDDLSVNKTGSDTDIDDVFKKITNIYTKYHYQFILSNLELLDIYQNDYINYIKAINHGMKSVNDNLRKWISDNIVY